MESAIGRISVLDQATATVVIESPLACRRCAEGKGCGAGIFQAGDRAREIRVTIPAGMQAREGDSIELAIGPEFLLRAALLAYGLPLASMLIFLSLAWMLSGNPGDGPGIALATIGLVVGIIAGRRILNRASICEQFIPIVTRVCGD
jgi:sigma-E factor negative regulatory protein RseC